MASVHPSCIRRLMIAALSTCVASTNCALLASAARFRSRSPERGNDTVYGDEGFDFLGGGAGDDWLFGGVGDDILVGGTGDDVLGGGLGADELSGGAGLDVASYTLSDAAVTINLSNAGSTTDLAAETGLNIDMGGTITLETEDRFVARLYQFWQRQRSAILITYRRLHMVTCLLLSFRRPHGNGRAARRPGAPS